MICQNCKKRIDDDSNFCKYCGSKVIVANKCPHCGATPLPKDAKFCPDCGSPLVQKNEKTIRREAARIVAKYPKGYKRFVLRQQLPNFSNRVGIKNCEKIISMEQEIASMNKKVIMEEQEYKNKIAKRKH